MSAVERKKKGTMESGAVLPNNKLLAFAAAAAAATLQTAGVIRRESLGRFRIRDSELMNCFWWPVHLKMKKGSTVLAISILALLSLAYQDSWCAAAAAAEGSAGVSTARHRLRPHLQVQEQLHADMKDHLEIQNPSRKLGLVHEVSTLELKHRRRISTGHKGGSAGGGAGGGAGGAGAGGRNMGGGGAVARPHSSKNGAAALPVPVASVLALALGCAVALSALSF